MGKWQNFTAGRVEQFVCKPGKRQSIYWDGKAPGLGVRVTALGGKSYIFESRLYGKTIRMTVGDIRTWSIKQAQDRATAFKALVDQGIDPRQVAAKQATEQAERRTAALREQLTVSEVWANYLAVKGKRWSARTLADHIKLADPGGQLRKRGSGVVVPGALARMMPLKLIELDSLRIATWLDTEAAVRPTQAALAYRLIRGFLRWCSISPEYKALVNLDAVSSRIAKEHVPRVNPKADDCLQREQLAGWFGAVRQIPNQVISAYLQTLLLTGARREELMALRWPDVDFQWSSLRVADKLHEGGRIIPLTPYVATLLRELPKRNEWVFSSEGAKSGRLQEPRIQHNQALAKAGLPHVTLHGLRRSFGTLAEWVECPTGISAQIMGHKPSAIAEKHYRRRPIDLLRSWHTKIEVWILEQAGITILDQIRPGNVMRMVNQASYG
jgi:integrase